MNDRDTIICSESSSDLKDKVTMSEHESKVTSLFPSQEHKTMDEKTLGDLVKNAQTFIQGASITGIASIDSVGSPADILVFKRSGNLCYMSEVLGQEWVVPNTKISEEIKNRNPNGYIYVECQSRDAKAILVLCEEVKQLFEDGSYKIVYNPVTHHNVKRMSE